MSQHLGDRTPTAAGEFSDRIMAAIARESTPTPARTLVSALRARSADDAASALWVAWHLATVRRWRIAPSVRARSIALVLAVACALGTGSLGAAAALRVAAEPVVQLFQSGGDEHGPVENDPSTVDQQRAGEESQSGADGQGDEDGNADQSGTDQPGAGAADNDESDADEPADQDADNDESDADEPADQDADNEESDADDGQSDADEQADQDADPVDDDHSGPEPPDDEEGGSDDDGSGDEGSDEESSR